MSSAAKHKMVIPESINS